MPLENMSPNHKQKAGSQSRIQQSQQHSQPNLKMISNNKHLPVIPISMTEVSSRISTSRSPHRVTQAVATRDRTITMQTYSAQRKIKAVLGSYTLTHNEELNCTYLNNSKSWNTHTYTLLDTHTLFLNLHTLKHWSMLISSKPKFTWNIFISEIK